MQPVDAVGTEAQQPALMDRERQLARVAVESVTGHTKPSGGRGHVEQGVRLAGRVETFPRQHVDQTSRQIVCPLRVRG
jgi:hypothetical protein